MKIGKQEIEQIHKMIESPKVDLLVKSVLQSSLKLKQDMPYWYVLYIKAAGKNMGIDMFKDVVIPSQFKVPNTDKVISVYYALNFDEARELSLKQLAMNNRWTLPDESAVPGYAKVWMAQNNLSQWPEFCVSYKTYLWYVDKETYDDLTTEYDDGTIKPEETKLSETEN